MKRLIGLSLAIVIVGCQDQTSNELTWNERLAQGDITLCADRELTSSVIDSFARQAAEKTPLYREELVRAWDQEKAYSTFENVSATGFKPEIQELTCQGVLHIGDSDTLIEFMVRPSSALPEDIVFETRDLSPIAHLLLAVDLAPEPEATVERPSNAGVIEEPYSDDAAAAAAADEAMADAEANVAAAEAAVAGAAAEAAAAAAAESGH